MFFFDKIKQKNNQEANDKSIQKIELLKKAILKFIRETNFSEASFLLEMLLLPNISTEEIVQEFKRTITIYIEEKLNFKDFYFQRDEFQIESSLFNNYATARKELDGSYSICPIITNDELIHFMLEFYLLHYDQEKTFLEVLQEKNKEIHEDLLNSKINTYHGNLEFIQERSKAIVDALEMLRKQGLSEEELHLIEVRLGEAKEQYQKINGVCDNSHPNDHFNERELATKDFYFNVIVPAFERLLKIEEELSFISERIWKTYFDETGATLVHALTGEIVESDKMDKICTTLYLKDLATIPYGHTGYEYGFSMKNMECLCERDAQSWVITKEKFLKFGISHSWQWNEETNLFYETGYFSKLLLPEYIEEKVRENNRDLGEYIKYPEILLLNQKTKITPIKTFYTSDATEQEIQNIKKVAEIQGIEVEFIDTKTIEKQMTTK